MKIRTVTKGQRGDGKFEGMKIHYRGNFAIVEMPPPTNVNPVQLQFRALHRLEKDGYELLSQDGFDMIFRKVGSQPDAGLKYLKKLAKTFGKE